MSDVTDEQLAEWEARHADGVVERLRSVMGTGEDD